ncbi:hypothetical protein D3C80_1012060 [compost metagenome]
MHLDGQHIGVTQGATAAGVAPVVGHHGQGILTVEVLLALIGHPAREQRIDGILGAAQHQGAGAIAGHCHPAADRQVQGAVQYGQGHLHGAAACIHIAHLQTVNDEGLILLGHLGLPWQHVDGGIVHRAHIHLDAATHLGAKGTMIQTLGRHLDLQGAIGVVGHQLHRIEPATVRGDLPAAAAQVHHGAADPVRQANFCPVRYPFQGDAHLLGAIFMHVAGTAAGGLGIPRLQP